MCSSWAPRFLSSAPARPCETLATSALQNTYSQVQFSYVRNVHDKMVDVIRSEAFRPKFARFVCAGQFDCLLTVSRDAGVLLRHDKLGLLHSLAAVLELDGPERILVLVGRE